MTNAVCWSALTALATLTLCACTEGKDSAKEAAEVPANATVSPDVETEEISGDITRLFAAVKLDAHCPNDTTCVYLQTFPGGESREITLIVAPHRQYTPTSDEIAKTAAGSHPIYAFKYASDFEADPVKVDLEYYVAREGLPKGPAKTAQSSSLRWEGPPGVGPVRFAALGGDEPVDSWQMQPATAVQPAAGAGIYWREVGKKGADAAIGAVIDLAKDKGVKAAGPIGTIYSLASALSDGSVAMELGKQNTKWLSELDALEKCAASPTNQVSKSDPNYSNSTVAKIQAARSELKEVNAVRFLNQLTEKGADLSPVTAVMSIGLKQGFEWSEQTLGDYSENTIMREARLAVVACEDPGNLGGNITLATVVVNAFGERTVGHLVANVAWEWQRGVLYYPKGNYTYSGVRTAGSCTTKSSAEGSFSGLRGGALAVIDDPARQKELGYGYRAEIHASPTIVTVTSNCGVSWAQYTADVMSFPVIRGFQGAGGKMEGVALKGSIPGLHGTLTWAFSVPPAK